MLTSYFGNFIYPDVIAKKETNYTKDGLIIWQNLQFDAMTFEKRLYGENIIEIQKSLLDPNKAVILNVNDGQHWVVALRKTLFGNSYIVADPWFGDKCDVRKRYRNITGTSHFLRK